MHSKGHNKGKMDESAFAYWLEDTLLKTRTLEAITELPQVARFAESGPGGSRNVGMLFRFKDGSAFEMSVVEVSGEGEEA